MQFIMRVVVCMTVILAVVPYGLCIKCWDCRSNNDPKCGEPFDNRTLPITDCKYEKKLTDLGLVATLCRKIRQQVNGEWQIIRGCSYYGEDGIKRDERDCVTKTGTDNTIIEYCICDDKDGCNSSFTFTPKPVLLVLAVVTAGLKLVL